MRPSKSVRTALLATISAAAIAVTGAPAAAAESRSCTYVDGTLCLHESKWFNGATVEYPAPFGTDCVNSSMGFLGWLNLTDYSLRVYEGVNCTGISYYVPSGDLHNVQAPLSSFKVV